ncbi:MAG: nuclear transport factor 2 family protein [Bacteroidota bacterium]
MKRIITAMLLFVAFSFGTYAQKTNIIIKEVTNLLMLQKDAWNQGDLDKYMSYYWKSDSLRFMGKSGVTKGWQNTLDKYKKSFPDKETMGNLTFDNLQYESIDKDNIIVIGSWKLVRTKDNVGGYFSLLWRKINHKWVIIIDHTS